MFKKLTTQQGKDISVAAALQKRFSNIIIYVKIVGKIPDQHLSVWLFSNPGHKVQILIESIGHICPVVADLQISKSPRVQQENLERHYNRVVGRSVVWSVATLGPAGYNSLIPF